MRIRTTKTTNTVQYAIIKDITKNGKRTTCIFENLGTLDKIKQRAGNEEPLVWLKNYLQELNIKEKENKIPVLIKKDPSKVIEKNVQSSFNVGYLFFTKYIYKLKLDKICNKIKEQHQFKFDLNDILSKLYILELFFPHQNSKH